MGNLNSLNDTFLSMLALIVIYTCIPGQFPTKHDLSSLLLPTQGLPPYCGSMHVRDLENLPDAHVTEHFDQPVQATHSPSTDKIN